MDEVTCTGTEGTLFDCQYSKHHNCLHSEDAGVVCSSGTARGIRLRGGDEKNQGLVEIYAHGLWGTICNEGWGIQDANVVCRQLGFLEAVFAVRKSLWGEGDSVILMSNVQCDGSESTLYGCTFNRVHNCTHSQDAGVKCKKGEYYTTNNKYNTPYKHYSYSITFKR
ncbi:Deleted in malignant brain tumors 1 protein [Holothuria leucospilota]|uniref:Deleted in malignant brain tumors 1 protein n=1 Tax=Holothuria leucospilota TaxID=206669 RepID=A0A9Q1CSJ9_HOLLE|nr:Deleted in malignant brain tumors 1 protein [Holothuria leucospilota]